MIQRMLIIKYDDIDLSKAATDTNHVLGLLVSTGIDQQPHTVRVTIVGGKHQRRVSVLRVGFAKAQSAPSPDIIVTV